MGVLFGALTALAIGTSDLFGRKVLLVSSAITVGISLQFIAIFTSLAGIGIIDSTWDTRDFLVGALSGLGMAAGMGFYYSGLSRAGSTILSPIVATLSTVIPFVYTLATGNSVSTIALAGTAVAFVGLLLITGSAKGTRNVMAGLKWGLMSGMGYGFSVSVLTETGDQSGAWPAFGQRIIAFAALLTAAFALGLPKVIPTNKARTTVLAGIAIGLSTIFILIGLEADPPATVITAGMFPALAVAIGAKVYGDPIRQPQAIGIGIVLLGLTGVVAG